MERKSQVQIPKDLLLALFQYHLAGNEEYQQEIEKALMEKLDSKDIPHKQVSKWQKYSKKRQKRALYSYINTLYQADETLIEQIPELINIFLCNILASTI